MNHRETQGQVVTQFLMSRLGRRMAAKPPTGCPDDNLLAAHLEGRTTPEQQRAIEAHAAGCDACQFVLQEVEIEAPVEHPTLLEMLRMGAGGLDPQRAAEVEAHAHQCQICLEDWQKVLAHPEETRGLLNLVEAQMQLRVLGVMVSLTGVVETLRKRQAALGAEAAQRLHRSRENHLGEAASRRGTLMWDAFGLGEDTYVVELFGHGDTKATMKVHAPYCHFPEPVWMSLDIQPGEHYAWTVTAMANGKPVGETLKGQVWFLNEEDEASLLKSEAACRSLEADLQPLALGTLYREWGLVWEARRMFLRYVGGRPKDPVGYVLLGRACEDMGRVQEASMQFASANRLME